VKTLQFIVHGFIYSGISATFDPLTEDGYEDNGENDNYGNNEDNND